MGPPWISPALSGPRKCTASAGEELRGDPEQRGHPHPEDGARTTRGQCDRDAGNVAHPHGAGQCAGKRAKVAELARGAGLIETAGQELYGVREVAERQQPTRDEKPGTTAQQQNEQPRTPGKAGEAGGHVCNVRHRRQDADGPAIVAEPGGSGQQTPIMARHPAAERLNCVPWPVARLAEPGW